MMAMKKYTKYPIKHDLKTAQRMRGKKCEKIRHFYGICLYFLLVRKLAIISAIFFGKK